MDEHIEPGSLHCLRHIRMPKPAGFRHFVMTLIVLLVLAADLAGQDVHETARSGSLTDISLLLEVHPEMLDSLTGSGSFPLHFAAINPDTAVADFLLSRGADVKAANGSGYTPLHYAASYDRPDMVRLLLSHGADVEAVSLEGETPLHLAAAAGATEAGRVLLELGADPEAREARGRTALLVNARESGSTSFGELLLAHRADVNVTDRYGGTPLMLAAWRGYQPFVGLLLRAGAEIPSTPESQNKLLTYAVKKNLDSLFAHLLQAGLDLEACAATLPDLINHAAAGGSLATTRLLLDNGFSVHYADENGWTPLHCAAEFDRSGIVSFLCGEGADLNARTLSGESAYNIARSSASMVTAELLDSLGCQTMNAAFPFLDGPYLGQPLPGNVPEVFAPGIVSAHYKLHSSITFSPDGLQAAWSIMIPPRQSGYGSCSILHSHYQNGRWGYPQPLSEDPCDVPFFDPGGDRLYYLSRQPAWADGPAKENIWFREWAGGCWSTPMAEVREVNESPMHWQFSIDSEGAIYFGTGEGRIMVSSSRDGRRQAPVQFSLTDDRTPIEGGAPYISPQGDCLLFSREGDIHATIRDQQGKWSEVLIFDEAINTPATETCPMLSPDGSLLFFNRDWKVYWVSVEERMNAFREQVR